MGFVMLHAFFWKPVSVQLNCFIVCHLQIFLREAGKFFTASICWIHSDDNFFSCEVASSTQFITYTQKLPVHKPVYRAQIKALLIFCYISHMVPASVVYTSTNP